MFETGRSGALIALQLASPSKVAPSTRVNQLRLKALGTHLHGGLLETSTGAHSFTFMRRHGILAKQVVFKA